MGKIRISVDIFSRVTMHSMQNAILFNHFCPPVCQSVTLWYCFQMTACIVKLSPSYGRWEPFRFLSSNTVRYQNSKENPLSKVGIFAIFDVNRSLRNGTIKAHGYYSSLTGSNRWHTLSLSMTSSDIERFDPRNPMNKSFHTKYNVNKNVYGQITVNASLLTFLSSSCTVPLSIL